MSSPAGWYPQSDGQQRYWDGEMWTEHFAPGVAPVTTSAVGESRSKTAVIGWVVVLALLLLFSVSAAATAGLGGVLIMLGLAALVAGVVASVRGRLPVLRVASRRAGVLMAASGLALTTVGGAISPNLATTGANNAVETVEAVPTPADPGPVATIPTPTPVVTQAPKPTAIPGPTVVTARPAAAPTTTQAKPPAAGTALAAVAGLTVKGRAPKTGYTRGQFGQTWFDTDRNGCDTRNDILRRDLGSRQMKNACKVLAGTLVPDPYTGTSIRFVYGGASEVDIDHVVALSDAWQKGAASWPAGKRLALANDPLNLLAVQASANRSKGDGDTATWLPPNMSFRCTYVARQVAVKGKYGVWVTAAERDAMTRILRACPSMRLPAPGSAPTLAALPKTAPVHNPPPVVERAPAPAPAPAPEPSATEYANCTAMHEDYKGGVARPGAVDRRASGHARYAPVYSASLYNANSGSDRDKDGVACEK
jgi:hypothetical protein